MQIEDPPISNVVVSFEANHYHGVGVCTIHLVDFSVRDRDGITFGLLESMLQKAWTDLNEDVEFADEGEATLGGRICVDFRVPKVPEEERMVDDSDWSEGQRSYIADGGRRGDLKAARARA